MRLSTLLIGALTLSLVAMPARAAAQSAPQSKPDPKTEQKPDPKAESPVAGKWNMAIETPGGQRPATLAIKLDGKKVTGSMASEAGEVPVTGEFADGKLVFSITIDANGQQFAITFTGAVQKDGSLSGGANMAGQDMSWTATRVKEK